MSKAARQRSTRERVEQVRREQRTQQWRRGLLIGGPVALVVAAGVGLGVYFGVTGSDASGSGASESGATGQPIAMRTTPPPWPEPEREAAYIEAAGLPARSGMAETYHIHAHLDVIIDGENVPVPPGIGILESQQALSPLHTHEGNGILHVENPQPVTVTLGQFFTQWGVKLTGDQIGGLRAGQDQALRVYVNGKEVRGDPSNITLKNHAEIAVWYGPASATPQVPESYDFGNL